MSQRRAKALAGGLFGMAAVATWAITSGWLANQPPTVAIVGVLGWLGITVLMVIVNIF